MSYYLRGSDGDGGGLGAVEPTYEKCVPTDSACVARNQAAGAVYGAAQLAESKASMLAYCLTNVGQPGGPSAASCHAEFDPGGYYSYDALANIAQANAFQAVQPRPLGTPTVTPPAAARGGQLTFTTSRGGQGLQVGDTWLVAITGATPKAPVTVSGSMPGSSFSGSSMGSTDSNGNYSKSGTAGAGDVGAWQESWAVGGVPSGSFSFTVAPAVAASTPAVTFATGGGTAAGSAPAGGAAASSSSTVIGGFDLSTIPVWGWVVAAGVALFAFGGKR